MSRSALETRRREHFSGVFLFYAVRRTKSLLRSARAGATLSSGVHLPRQDDRCVSYCIYSTWRSWACERSCHAAPRARGPMWAGMQLGPGLLPPAWPWERRESAVNRARRVGSRCQWRLRRSQRHTSSDLPKHRTNSVNFGPCVIVRVVVDRPAANIAPCATCVKRTCMVAPSLAAPVRIGRKVQQVRVAL